MVLVKKIYLKIFSNIFKNMYKANVECAICFLFNILNECIEENQLFEDYCGKISADWVAFV